jgi:hypothetical protein
MSKLLEHKQIIHIASEVVVLSGLVFYFSSKNKKLLEHIEDLAQRMEDQEDQIQKLETAVKNIGNLVQNRILPSLQQYIPPLLHESQSQQQPVKPTPSRKVRPSQRKPHRSASVKHHEKPPVNPPPKKSVPVVQSSVQFQEEYAEEYAEDSVSSIEGGDSDLDEEIQEELSELTDQHSLKKQ